MGQIAMDKVQRILHLDTEYPYFPAWEDVQEFELHGVHVKAIVTHKWRAEFIRIAEPFEVHGSEYGFGFQPMLIAIGATFAARNRSLAKEGMSVRDHWLQKAKSLYRIHSCYLKSKSAIDIEQEAYFSVFRDEIDVLRKEFDAAQERMSAERKMLRNMLRETTISQKEYQFKLSVLRKETEHSSKKLLHLEADVNHELEKIKKGYIATCDAIV
jgi:hypothetical protein